MTRALLQQALDALDSCYLWDGNQVFDEDRVFPAIEAIRAELAKPTITKHDSDVVFLGGAGTYEVEPGPAWHDAPTVPGDWVMELDDGRLKIEQAITQGEIDLSAWEGRTSGPIP